MRKTALVSVDRRGHGGSYHDSITHAKLFKAYTPYNFGVKMAQRFSQEIGSHLVNKRFTYMTMAQDNSYMLPAGVDDYCWYLGQDSETEFRFTEVLVNPTSQPGKGNVPFKIACDKDWLHEPAVIKLAGHGLPLLRILGHPIRRSANSFEYEVMIQDGDPNVFIPVSELQPDKTFVRVSSLVADELNYKFAPDSYGDMFKLQSWVSNYANKAEFTDKALRLEMGAKGGKTSYTMNGVKTNGPTVSAGYLYSYDVRDKNTGEVVQKGAFITAVEAKLEARIQMDREMMMEFGRLDKTVDPDSGRVIKAAPGWQQLVQDGYYLEHNGSLSLDQLFNFLNNIFLNRRGFKDRKIVLSGGEAAIRWLSRLIFQEYSSIVTTDSHFVRPNSTPTGVHANELEFGAQFTKIQLMNGLEVSIQHDPMKDNKSLHKTLAPNTNAPLESYALDIFDFGATDQTATGADMQNITMVAQDEVEAYWTVSNVFDFEKGVIKDGSNAYALNKEAGIYRELSGSLCIWDVERVGRIAINPFI